MFLFSFLLEKMALGEEIYYVTVEQGGGGWRQREGFVSVGRPVLLTTAPLGAFGGRWVCWCFPVWAFTPACKRKVTWGGTTDGYVVAKYTLNLARNIWQAML